MLDVLHGIDMPIDIYIVIFGFYCTNQLGAIVHLYTTAFINGAFLVIYNPVVDGTVVNREDIGRLTCFGINHGPDTTSVAIHLTILAYYTEVTTGKETHSTLNPCLNIKLSVHLWHLVHLDGQS